jgi:hypothetical protein
MLSGGRVPDPGGTVGTALADRPPGAGVVQDVLDLVGREPVVGDVPDDMRLPVDEVEVRDDVPPAPALVDLLDYTPITPT